MFSALLVFETTTCAARVNYLHMFSKWLPSRCFTPHVPFWDDKERELEEQNVGNDTAWGQQG